MKNQNASLSFWVENSRIRLTTRLYAQNKPVDVIIVGLGLAGLWFAINLISRNPRLIIRIVEKGAGPSGASINNAGFACFWSISELLSNLKCMKEDEVWDLVEMKIKSIAMIRRSIGDGNIDYNPCGGYECLVGPASSHYKILDNIDMINHNLYKITKEYPVFKICGKEKLDEFGFSGFTSLIHNKLEGSLDSAKLLKHLIRRATVKGIQIHNHFDVKNLIEKNDYVEVVNESGASFKARRVVLCTNGYTKDLLPISLHGIKPGRGQTIVTSEIRNLSFRGTFHFNEGFNYFRNIGNRVLLGGARDIAFKEETTTKMETSTLIQDELERILKENILPGRNDYTIDYRSAAPMGFTDTHKPMMRKLESYKYVDVICGCNGMGVSTLPAFTKILAERFSMDR